jgi:hypothetical protein
MIVAAATAKNHFRENELNGQNKRTRTRGWPPKRRQNQRCTCLKTRPWTYATGPRTQVGRAKSSKNAQIGPGITAQNRNLSRLLRQQRLWLKITLAARRLKLPLDACLAEGMEWLHQMADPVNFAP